jgi:hypothetical protein
VSIDLFVLLFYWGVSLRFGLVGWIEGESSVFRFRLPCRRWRVCCFDDAKSKRKMGGINLLLKVYRAIIVDRKMEGQTKSMCWHNKKVLMTNGQGSDHLSIAEHT